MNRAELQQFAAGEDETRIYINPPWSRGEWSYATNGHILVRVPRLDDVDENPKAPGAEKLLAETKQAKFIPVPVCAPPPDVDCRYCGGKGYFSNGRGYPRDKCLECSGTKKVPCFDGVDVGNSHFQRRYLAMIQGWEIAPNGQKAAWIRNGDAVGLLMPRRKD